jgi:phage/plasmid-associated DNA primase
MSTHIDEFIRACCWETGDGTVTTARDMYGVYLTWCEAQGHEPLSAGRLSEWLGMHHVHHVRNGYQGVQLTGPYVVDYILDSASPA